MPSEILEIYIVPNCSISLAILRFTLTSKKKTKEVPTVEKESDGKTSSYKMAPHNKPCYPKCERAQYFNSRHITHYTKYTKIAAKTRFDVLT